MGKKLDTHVEDLDDVEVTDDKPAPPLWQPAKPGEAGYDWAQHYDDGAELYRHTFDDGTVVALKVFGSIYSKTWLYKVRNAQTNAELEFAAIDRAACDEARQVLEGLDENAGDDPIDQLWQAWSKAGTSRGAGDDGLTPGN